MATDGFVADYTELARLAGEVLKAADGISSGIRASRAPLTVAPAAFGDSSAGPAVHSAHLAVVEQGGTTNERLVEVLEGDVDRLYRVAFAYQKIDQDAADRLCRGHRMGGPTPC
ncbi:MAG: hypothetical protein DLM59_09890 [Pseudonocardiales bacterium]|nr:MAG: hypothetical protein DLM59_09890 [Pseudonocardiales bacterium]